MLTPDAMEALLWVAEAVGCISAVALCAMYAVAMTALVRLLCQESGQEGANAWQAAVEDYEGPQDDSRGGYGRN